MLVKMEHRLVAMGVVGALLFQVQVVHAQEPESFESADERICSDRDAPR